MSGAEHGADRVTAPMVGISAYCEQARWGVWEAQAMVLPRRYADRIAQAGGIPVLLPPVPGIEDAVARLDGLVLSGGGDVDPARYGAQRGPLTTSVREDRDAAEIALLTTALGLKMPVLGICRGMQLINVALGGSLHQHLPDVVGHHDHSPSPGTFGSHEIKVAPGSCLAAILGLAGSADAAAIVPTHHHQGIDRLGEGLTVTAWATDGTIEAFELDQAEHPFGVAVQWHPEAGDDASLFTALVSAARARAEASSGAGRSGSPGPNGSLATASASLRRRPA